MIKTEYYDFPLRPADLMQKKEQPRVPVKDSVARMIHLITVTHYGEYKFDQSLGCEIWDFDFVNITNYQLFKENIRNSLMQTIARYEPRLSSVRVDVQMQQVEIRIMNRRTKAQINLKVEGVLSMTNEPFLYQENFFIGPLSYY
jgi:phage baseplate assembly protein W